MIIIQKMLHFILNNSQKKTLLLIFRQFVMKKNYKKSCNNLKKREVKKIKNTSSTAIAAKI
jgi:hypothetical protein